MIFLIRWPCFFLNFPQWHYHIILWSHILRSSLVGFRMTFLFFFWTFSSLISNVIIMADSRVLIDFWSPRSLVDQRDKEKKKKLKIILESWKKKKISMTVIKIFFKIKIRTIWNFNDSIINSKFESFFLIKNESSGAWEKRKKKKEKKMGKKKIFFSRALETYQVL